MHRGNLRVIEGSDRRLDGAHAQLPVGDVGDGRHVGGDEKAVAKPGEVVDGRRFGLPHVGGVAAETPGGDRLDQRGVVDDRPATC